MMEFYVADRQRGKTTALVEWAKAAPDDEHRVVVCMSHHEAQALEKEHGIRAFSYDFIRKTHVGVEGKRTVLGVDDLDRVLSRVFKQPVGFVTASGEVAGVVPA